MCSPKDVRRGSPLNHFLFWPLPWWILAIGRSATRLCCHVLLVFPCTNPPKTALRTVDLVAVAPCSTHLLQPHTGLEGLEHSIPTEAFAHGWEFCSLYPIQFAFQAGQTPCANANLATVSANHLDKLQGQGQTHRLPVDETMSSRRPIT